MTRWYEGRSGKQFGEDGCPAPARQSTIHNLFRVGRMLGRDWLALGQALALGLLVAVCSTIPPFLAKVLIDRAYPTRDESLVTLVVVTMAGIGLGATVLSALRDYVSVQVTSRLSSAVSLMFFNHVQHLPLGFFDRRPVGEISSRLEGVQRSMGIVSELLNVVATSAVYLIVVPPFLFLIDWRLALLALAIVPLNTGMTILSQRRLSPYWHAAAQSEARVTALQVEAIAQVPTFKAMALEPFVFSRVRADAHGALRTRLRATQGAALINLGSSVLRVAHTAALTWLGWHLVLNNQLTLGEYIACQAYASFLNAPAWELAGFIAGAQEYSAALDRMCECLDERPEQDPTSAYDRRGPIRQLLRGEVEFQNVSFGYRPDQRILDHLSLHIQAGSMTALVGPSGGGKTSLLRLITRSLEPNGGAILVDRQDIATLELSDLRRQIGVVWQDTTLLNASLWANLTIGLVRPSRQAVDRVVHICHLDTMLAGLQGGYDDLVAERGANLSGGQRQRVAVARALLRGPAILILDEALSNVEVPAELEILRAIRENYPERTVIVASHRPEVAALASQVLHLPAGRSVHQEVSRAAAAFPTAVGRAV